MGVSATCARAKPYFVTAPLAKILTQFNSAVLKETPPYGIARIL